MRVSLENLGFDANRARWDFRFTWIYPISMSGPGKWVIKPRIQARVPVELLLHLVVWVELLLHLAVWVELLLHPGVSVELVLHLH